MASTDVWLSKVVPSIALCLSTAMYVSSTRTFHVALTKRNMAGLSSRTYIFFLPMAVSWLFYGLLKSDIFITIPQLIGTIMTLFYVFCFIAVSPYPKAVAVMLRTLGLLALVMVTQVVLFFTLAHDRTTLILAEGIVADIIYVAYSGIPLGRMLRAVRMRDASAFCPYLGTTSLVANGLWVVYGLVVQDWVFTVVCLFGAVMFAGQLVLIALFGRGGHGGLCGRGCPTQAQPAAEATSRGNEEQALDQRCGENTKAREGGDGLHGAGPEKSRCACCTGACLAGSSGAASQLSNSAVIDVDSP
eukprot:comp6936_c0_seq1/m.2680 comp6936_c0_seq1/g.2680  ORF comp6936_c0_seq1/g.2680 comp6936_c0_seq1/m.2680 type:complete len:302 (-) comp6936_c0_seq1:179-1084(-)